jgi:MFS family permease/quinol monooxygenase YgiN
MHSGDPSKEQRPSARDTVSPGHPFHHPVFRALWIATVVSNVGTWMYNAAAGWLMTGLENDPLIVSLVQVATSLPMFLFALPAGALADIVDRRRFIVVLEILTTVVSAIFALLVSLNVATSPTLLLFMFLVGAFGAIESPAWQSIVPQLVPKQDLSAAVAANSVGFNISRAIGPAVAGIIIGGLGIAAPFWLDAVSNAGVIGVLLWWRPPSDRATALPAERFTAAIRTGFRYTRHNRHLRAALARAGGFFLFASAYWALLPLLARSQIKGGPELYGLLLAAIGTGAVGGAFLLPWLKAKLGADRLVAAGTVGTAVALALFGLARTPLIGLSASLIAGASWIAVLSSVNVAAQVALPEWVRGRGLAMYVTVFFGMMTVGSTLWGEIAGIAGLPLALFAAAAGAVLAIPLTWHWKLLTGGKLDLAPSMHWPEPVVTGLTEMDAGPVMVTVEYRIDPENRDAFLEALQTLARERKRDGAYAWGVFQDTADPQRFCETFFVESWLEHLRQHERVTKADRVVQEAVRHFHIGGEPKVTHLIAAESSRSR